MIRFKLSPEQRKEINFKINRNPEKIQKTKLALEKLRSEGKMNYSGNKERMTEDVKKKIFVNIIRSSSFQDLSYFSRNRFSI